MSSEDVEVWVPFELDDSPPVGQGKVSRPALWLSCIFLRAETVPSPQLRKEPSFLKPG